MTELRYGLYLIGLWSQEQDPGKAANRRRRETTSSFFASMMCQSESVSKVLSASIPHSVFFSPDALCSMFYNPPVW